ncbi:F-box protein [Vitis vinifera]|uniref:F-box protein n=1 Tax=Vitis vinifera TaxID=29760 RepID=A0A438JT99_VITVI|nr:F-box protein [Vitis vinifera]
MSRGQFCILQDVLRSQNQQTSVATVAPAREFRGRLPNSDLPDMNQELPALPAPASSMDDKEASTSRTQSFDVDHILAHAEEPIHSKSSPYRDVSLEVDPSSRWVKRLRVSASDSFAHGTKTSKLGETSSNEKVNKFFSKIMKHNMPSSEFTWGRRRGKEPMELDQTAVWCRNRSAAPKKKPDAVVVCEPQSSKAALDELQKKQFPSIAAMALMGKAMTSFSSM